MSTTLSEIENFTLNDDLSKRVAKNNPDNMQIVRVRFDDKDKSTDTDSNEVILAIDRANNSEFCSSEVSMVFNAYPVILETGKIDTDKPLVIKIIKDSERNLPHLGNKAQQKDSLKWQRAKPNKNKRDASVKIEAKNNRLTGFYSRAGLILKENTNEEAACCERVLVMPKAPGTPLAKTNLHPLTQEKRIRLAINFIDYFDKKLHKNESGPIIYRDIKAENVTIDPNTLQVTVFDIDSSHNSQETKAPEDPNTPDFGTIESDIYSLALDILTPIFSGIRAIKDEAGNITNFSQIEDKIIENFTVPGLYSTPNTVSSAIRDLLETMCDTDPKNRTGLEKATEILITQLKVVTGDQTINADRLRSEQEEARKEHEAKLTTLKDVLQDAQYNLNKSEPLSEKKKASSQSRYTFLPSAVTGVAKTIKTNFTPARLIPVH